MLSNSPIHKAERRRCVIVTVVMNQPSLMTFSFVFFVVHGAIYLLNSITDLPSSKSYRNKLSFLVCIENKSNRV